MDEIKCNKCGWTGDYEQLISLTDDLDDKDFSYCPRCESKDIENIEEEE